MEVVAFAVTEVWWGDQPVYVLTVTVRLTRKRTPTIQQRVFRQC